MKYIGIILNLPMFFILIFLGISMKKSDIDINPVFGYRTKASRSSKEAWNFANKQFGSYLLILSIITLIFSLFLTFFLNTNYSTLIALLPIILLLLLLFIAIFKTERDLRKNFNIENNSTKKFSKFNIIATSIIFVGVGAILIFSLSTIPTKPYKLSLSNTAIKIEGWGSADISLASIKELKLLKTSPNVEWNSGGGNLDNKIFGTEHLENYGDTKCFVENTNTSSLFIKTSDTQYLIGFYNDTKTLDLFKSLENKLKL